MVSAALVDAKRRGLWRHTTEFWSCAVRRVAATALRRVEIVVFFDEKVNVESV
jgi:hypothetical protein